jgi:hypothetical protein
MVSDALRTAFMSAVLLVAAAVCGKPSVTVYARADQVDRDADAFARVIDAGDREAPTVHFETRICGEVVEAKRTKERELPLIAGGAARRVGRLAFRRTTLLPTLLFPLRPRAAEAIPMLTHFIDHAGAW